MSLTVRTRTNNQIATIINHLSPKVTTPTIQRSNTQDDCPTTFMLKFMDYDSSPGAVCWDVNCAVLPVGYLLLAVDSYFDICWVLWPSLKTASAVKAYYTTILTPRAPYLFPGYWFPVYVIFLLCAQCPTAYNYVLLVLFGVVAYRYVGILRGTDHQLRHWWTVIVVRVLLAIYTTRDIQSLQCRSMANYAEHWWSFLSAEQA